MAATRVRRASNARAPAYRYAEQIAESCISEAPLMGALGVEHQGGDQFLSCVASNSKHTLHEPSSCMLLPAPPRAEPLRCAEV